MVIHMSWNCVSYHEKVHKSEQHKTFPIKWKDLFTSQNFIRHENNFFFIFMTK